MYEEAGALHQRALTIDEMAYGPNHPTVAEDLNHLAELFRVQVRSASLTRGKAVASEWVGQTLSDCRDILGVAVALFQLETRTLIFTPLAADSPRRP